jgi:hypothetical protein
VVAVVATAGAGAGGAWRRACSEALAFLAGLAFLAFGVDLGLGWVLAFVFEAVACMRAVGLGWIDHPCRPLS